MARRRALVLGAGGFIGSHLVRRLKAEGAFVRGVDLRLPAFSPSVADDFHVADLRHRETVEAALVDGIDEVYQLAADMGGAGYVFTGLNDAEIMANSAAINLHVLHVLRARPVERVFFASSACVYPARNQTDPRDPRTAESSAYPAEPDSEYGWEKLFAERLYAAHARNCGMAVRMARYHNIYGPEGAWTGGREKAPAALCRKVAEAADGGTVAIWGDGDQTRSFLFIEDCIDATLVLMRSDHAGPLNVGSEEMISINALALTIADIAGKRISLVHEDGPVGVRGRTSDNRLVHQVLHWEPVWTLQAGLEVTYRWVAGQVAARAS